MVPNLEAEDDRKLPTVKLQTDVAERKNSLPVCLLHPPWTSVTLEIK
jgi:hypothetical protein